jgi:hypothetical protein
VKLVINTAKKTSAMKTNKGPVSAIFEKPHFVEVLWVDPADKGD